MPTHVKVVACQIFQGGLGQNGSGRGTFVNVSPNYEDLQLFKYYF